MLINGEDLYLFDLTSQKPQEMTLASCMENGLNKQLIIEIELAAVEAIVEFVIYNDARPIHKVSTLSEAVDLYNEI